MTTSRKNNAGCPIVIWQWNCRGFKNKKGDLQQHIANQQDPPDVIAIQESTVVATLPGYFTQTTQEGRDVCTLIKKNITAIHHQISINPHDCVLTELVSQKLKCTSSLFILNIYCRPKNKSPGLADMIRQAKCLAGSNPFIVVGDFNAAHSEWGYTYVNKRGKELSGIIDEENLTLLTEPNAPTRIGTSTARDTSPDLTLVAHAPNAT